jgi:hypothetical protein
MTADQIHALVEAAVNSAQSANWWLATILSLMITPLIAAGCAYLGALLQQKGQYSAMRRDIAEITRLQKNVEFQAKGHWEFRDRILLERYQIVRDINRRLEFIRYQYELYRANPKDHELRIVNGDTRDCRELIQILDLNQAILGNEFYPLLKQKYDRVVNFWNGALDWPTENANWSMWSTQIQARMAEVFEFDLARLSPVAAAP